MFRSMPIARASVGAGRPHDWLRIRRGGVAAEAQLQMESRTPVPCSTYGQSRRSRALRAVPQHTVQVTDFLHSQSE